MSPFYPKAIESLQSAVEHYLKKPDSINKNLSLMMTAKAVNLLLMEMLQRISPNVVYATPYPRNNPDTSKTINIYEVFDRIDTYEIELSTTSMYVIERLEWRSRQRKLFDHEDEFLLVASLGVALELIEVWLMEPLDEAMPVAMLQQIQNRIFTEKVRICVAGRRLRKWQRATWLDRNMVGYDERLECQVCQLYFVVVNHKVPHGKAFCFSCATSVDESLYPPEIVDDADENVTDPDPEVDDPNHPNPTSSAAT